jgi:DNA polymerase-3 subunit alpha
MRLLIFDTETTGLPKSRDEAYKKPDNWPHIVSISWVILDSLTNKITTQKSYIIKPENWIIPDESIAIHRITNEIAFKEGVSLKHAIDEFLAESCDKIVAHNIKFDINVIENAIVWDLKMSPRYIPKSMDCTMIISQKYCKTKNHKFPRLKEMYEFIFKRQPCEDKLHGSLYDTLILTECIQKCDWLRNELGLLKSPIYRTNGISTSTLSFNLSETH